MSRSWKQSILILLAAAALTTQLAQGGKPATTSCVVNNTTGVSSDNQGAYTNGKDKVTVEIDSAGDFLLAFNSGSGRSLNMNYGNPVDPTNAPFSGVHVVNGASTTNCCDAITVRDLLSIPVGTTSLRAGYILVQDVYVDANGIPHVATQTWNQLDGDTDGILFSVTRTASSQWIVQSQNVANGDVSPLRFNHNTGTSWVFESAADYHMPISLTINQ